MNGIFLVFSENKSRGIGKYRGQTVAVKVLKSKVGPKQLDEFQKEFAIMSAIRTPHVVFFYGACVNPTLYMVFFFFFKDGLLPLIPPQLRTSFFFR